MYRIPGRYLVGRFNNEERLLQHLRSHHYFLTLPLSNDLTAVQKRLRDTTNCGPLAVYFMIVANKHTPPFDQLANFTALKQTTGITIR